MREEELGGLEVFTVNFELSQTSVTQQPVTS